MYAGEKKFQKDFKHLFKKREFPFMPLDCYTLQADNYLPGPPPSEIKFKCVIINSFHCAVLSTGDSSALPLNASSVLL